MNKMLVMKSIGTLFFAVGLLVGCSPGNSPKDSSEIVPETADTIIEDSSSSGTHPGDPDREGPHGGMLVELGRAAYLAEIVALRQSVLVYVLDRSGRREVPINAADLTLAIGHDGRVTSHRMTAFPRKQKQDGNSGDLAFDSVADVGSETTMVGTARFVSRDPSVRDRLSAGSSGAVTVPISGRWYTGRW